MRILMYIFMATITFVGSNTQNVTAADQLVIFKKNTAGPIGVLTTSSGKPIEYSDGKSTLNQNLFLNDYFIDEITHFVRERIPERTVHGKGAGAFGYFEVTHDITDICKANLFNKVGKRTPIVVRFSPVGLNKGGIDTSREPRGFAVKFYTREGNFDIVGINTPTFPVKDPLLFSSLTRTQKRNPATFLNDNNIVWDHLTRHQESLATFLLVFGDRGVPDGYRHMPGYGIHTFQVVNQNGDSYFIRFHFTPNAGIRNLQSAEAVSIAGSDPDYATRDLYNAIANGNYPSWNVSAQVLTESDVKSETFDVFDVSRSLSLIKYPLRPLGRLVLNENPSNYFADIEQLALCPSNLVPGIVGAPDKVFEARCFLYKDAQNYRLGANFNKIAVNCPFRTKVLSTYNRDGLPPVKDNYGGIPNYYPNSFNGPVPCKDCNRQELIKITEKAADNIDLTRDIYLNEMTEDERERAISNLLVSLRGATPELQDRAVEMFTNVDPDLGSRVLAGL